MHIFIYNTNYANIYFKSNIIVLNLFYLYSQNPFLYFLFLIMSQENRYSSLSENYVNQRLQRLPLIIRKHRQNFNIIFFQFIGITILSYGLCCTQYIPPVRSHIPNPIYQILISCFLFLAMTWTYKVTGGYLNPSVTIAYTFKKQGLNKKTSILYLLTQFGGALFGALLAWRFFDSVTAPYTTSSINLMSKLSIFNDCVGQFLGTFLFVFLFLLFSNQQTTLIKDQFWINTLISLMYFISKTITFRKSVLNPALGFALQFWQTIESRNGVLLVYSLILIIPSILGGIVASIFFQKLYKPLVNQFKQDWKQQ